MKKYEYLHQLLWEWRAMGFDASSGASIQAKGKVLKFMDDHPQPHMLGQDRLDVPLPFKPGQSLREAVNDALLKAQAEMPVVECTHIWVAEAFSDNVVCVKCHFVRPPSITENPR